jgi:hypothetical protein
MSRSTRIMATLAVTMTAVAVVIPAQANSKFKTTINSKTTLSGTKVTGTFTGSPFGSGSVKGNAALPYFYFTYYAKGGSLTMKYKGSVTSTGHVTGPYTWLSGTGKYRHIKGSGTGYGTPNGKGYKNFNFTYTGTATW